MSMAICRHVMYGGDKWRAHLRARLRRPCVIVGEMTAITSAARRSNDHERPISTYTWPNAVRKEMPALLAPLCNEPARTREASCVTLWRAPRAGLPLPEHARRLAWAVDGASCRAPRVPAGFK